MKYIQRVPALRVFWDLEKTVLHETRVSGTVLWSSTNADSLISGNRVSDFRVSGVISVSRGPQYSPTNTNFM